MKRKLKLNNGGSVSGVMGSLSGIANMIPGWGQAIGAGLGMIGDIFGNEEQAKKNAEAAQTAAHQARIEREGEAYKEAPMSRMTLAMGGDILKEFNAPAHAQGGQAIDQNGNPAMPHNAVAEIEKNETVDGNYAFSPNLITDGMSFADKSKKIEKKYKKQIENGDDIARRTRDREMDSLKAKNDAAREQAELEQQLMQSQMAYGGTFGDPPKNGQLRAMPQMIRRDMQGNKSDSIQAPEGALEQSYLDAKRGYDESGKIADDMDFSDLNKDDKSTEDMKKMTAEKLRQIMEMHSQKGWGGKYKKANGGPIKPNDNPYAFTDYDTASTMFADDKALQQAIVDYGKSIGQKYLPKYGADGKAGKETKGFFSDPNRVSGFANYMNRQSQDNKSLANPFGTSLNYSHPNQVTPMTSNTRPQSSLENVNANLPTGQIAPIDMSGTAGDTNLQQVAYPDTGSVIPLGDKMRNAAIRTGKPIGQFFTNLADGKYDSTIGTVGKGVELAGAIAMALRQPEQIPVQSNSAARRAEILMERRGQELTAARQANREGLARKLQSSGNAMSSSVQQALQRGAISDYTLQGIDIAGKEKAINDQVTAQLASMVTGHGAQAMQERIRQEALQSQTNAKQADMVRQMFADIGNAGEFFAQKGAARKKDQEQLMLLANKYGNFTTTTDLTEYWKAAKTGDVDGIIKFMNQANINSIDEALEDFNLSDAEKAKVKKKYKAKTKTK